MAIEMSVVKGRVVLQIDAEEPFTIGDVSRFTSYNVRTLQRLEEGRKIPLSVRDSSGRRVWRAADIIKIREHRATTILSRGRHAA